MALRNASFCVLFLLYLSCTQANPLKEQVPDPVPEPQASHDHEHAELSRFRRFTGSDAAKLENSQLVEKLLRSMANDRRYNQGGGGYYGDTAYLQQAGNPRKRWYERGSRSPASEVRFPLPERRMFPEVDWRGFNEDVFHESFGDFNPMKRWKRR